MGSPYYISRRLGIYAKDRYIYQHDDFKNWPGGNTEITYHRAVKLVKNGHGWSEYDARKLVNQALDFSVLDDN